MLSTASPSVQPQYSGCTDYIKMIVLEGHPTLPRIMDDIYFQSASDTVARCLLMLKLGDLVFGVLPRDRDNRIYPDQIGILNHVRWDRLADEIMRTWTREAVTEFMIEDLRGFEEYQQLRDGDEVEGFAATGLPDECSEIGQQNAEEAYALK